MFNKIGPDDLEAIRNILKEELSNAVRQKEVMLFTRAELCEKLGIDKSTYHKHVKIGKLKVEKLGRKLLLK